MEISCKMWPIQARPNLTSKHACFYCWGGGCKNAVLYSHYIWFFKRLPLQNIYIAVLSDILVLSYNFGKKNDSTHLPPPTACGNNLFSNEVLISIVFQYYVRRLSTILWLQMDIYLLSECYQMISVVLILHDVPILWILLIMEWNQTVIKQWDNNLMTKNSCT